MAKSNPADVVVGSWLDVVGLVQGHAKGKVEGDFGVVASGFGAVWHGGTGSQKRWISGPSCFSATQGWPLRRVWRRGSG